MKRTSWTPLHRPSGQRCSSKRRSTFPAKGSPTRNRYKLKHNDTFVVLDSHGDIGAALGEPDGVFNNDTRFLSRLELHVDGQPTLLLGSRVRDDNTLLTADLTNPDIFHDGRIVLPKDNIHVVRTSFVWDDTFYTRFGIRNYGDRPVDLTLDLWFANDFADLFEVRGMRRARRGAGERAAARCVQRPPVVSRTRRCFRSARRCTSSRNRTIWMRRGRATGCTWKPASARRSSRPRASAMTRRVPLCSFFRALRAATRCAASHREPCRHPVVVQRCIRQHHGAIVRRPPHVDDADAAGRLSLRGHPLVFDDVRPRRHHHGAAAVVVHAVGRARRACPPCRPAGDALRSGQRRGARQDRARDAVRRNGPAARGAVRLLLRQRRCDAAVRAARRRILATHDRHRDDPAPLAQHLCCARLDRQALAGGRERLPPPFAQCRGWSRQSGLEGFVRLDLPRGRTACRGHHRAGRGPGLCRRGQAFDRGGGKSSGPRRRWRWSCRTARSVWRAASSGTSGARRSAPTASPSTAPANCAAPARRMRATCCLPVSYRKSGRDAWRPA